MTLPYGEHVDRTGNFGCFFCELFELTPSAVALHVDRDQSTAGQDGGSRRPPLRIRQCQYTMVLPSCQPLPGICGENTTRQTINTVLYYTLKH